jgi:hypothetical protein
VANHQARVRNAPDQSMRDGRLALASFEIERSPGNVPPRWVAGQVHAAWAIGDFRESEK